MNPKRDESPPIDDNFEIEQLSIDIFKSFLPKKEWLIREQRPDYYIDYKVEPTTEGHPDGRIFGVQLKGAGRIRTNRLCKQMKTNHLKYYLKARFPVFIFLIDTHKKQAFWIFAQKYLRNRSLEPRLSRQGTLALNFESKDNLSELSHFKTAVKDAFKYMESLYPGSVEDAAKARKEKLEKLDPRVSVNIGLRSGKETIEVFANGPVELKGKFHADLKIAKEALDALHQHGTPATLSVKNFKVQGSPLIQELGGNIEEGILTLSPNLQPGALQFEFNDAAGKSKLIQAEGNWRPGLSSSTLECRLGDSPMYLETTISFADFAKKRDLTLSMFFKWEAWSGKPIMALPHFDEICELVDIFAARQNVTLHWLIHGKWACSAIRSGDNDAAEALHYLRWIKACRDVARRLKTFPILPPQNEITESRWKGVVILKMLLEGESVSAKCPYITLTLPSMKPHGSPSSDSANPDDLTVVGGQEFDFLGHTVHLQIENIFSEMTIETSEETSEGITMHCKGTKNTRRIISLTSDAACV